MSKESIGGFSWALYEMDEGHKLYRRFWKNWQYVKLHNSMDSEEVNCSYYYFSPEPGLTIPWTPSQEDLRAQDWEIVLKCRNCGK